jgi:hypothetical protein
VASAYGAGGPPGPGLWTPIAVPFSPNGNRSVIDDAWTAAIDGQCRPDASAAGEREFAGGEMPDLSLGFGHCLSPQTPVTLQPCCSGGNHPKSARRDPSDIPILGCCVIRPRPIPNPPRGAGPPVSGPPDTGNGRASTPLSSASLNRAIPSENLSD